MGPSLLPKGLALTKNVEVLPGFPGTFTKSNCTLISPSDNEKLPSPGVAGTPLTLTVKDLSSGFKRS